MTSIKKDQLTASSKSLDMPMDNSQRDSAIPSTLQTSVLQFSSVYCITTRENGDQQFGETGKFDEVNMNIFCHEAPNMHDSDIFI